MSEFGELIELPNGTRLYYRDEDHSYWRCKPDGGRSTRLTGVTTVIKPLDFRPDNLMRWAARTNGIGIARLVSDGLTMDDPEAMREALLWLNSAESIWATLEQKKLTYENVRDEAATIGTNVHRLSFAALARGEAVPSYDDMTEAERKFAAGVVKFWLDHSPEALQIEQIVCDPELGIAGRFDLRGRLSECNDDLCPCATGISLVDAKTGSGYISTAAHAQLALYDYAATACGIGGSDNLYILKLSDQGDYELLEAQATDEDALVALDCYRRAARIGNSARKARKLQANRAAA